MADVNKDVAAVLTAGDFNSMSQEWQPDGSCIIALRAKSGKVFTATVSKLYKSGQVVSNAAEVVKEEIT